MNTNLLKKFAQAARVKLIEQVTAKLDFVLTHDTAELRGKAEILRKLEDEISLIGKAALIDRVAYTWFNRLIALRFMDANGFQPLGYSVVTAQQNQVSPQILDEAHAGHISDELPVDKQAVMDLLDGRMPSGNPDNDAYRLLLVASCNHLYSILPFLFERINDYTELLLPDDLTSNFSIVKDVVDGMSEEDCKEVEIVGWLYQFYISQRKDEVFASKKAVQKEDIPAATQLFTPRWIVEYMVQNTLGKLWLQNKPGSSLKDHMPYYIESPSSQSKDYLKVNSVEEIKLLDQACGSGHILVYSFELLAKIYEEEGYNKSDIPQLIIEKNLYGFEIDERAAQLAGMALMMKARGYFRRFFGKKVRPNILTFQDLKLSGKETAEALAVIGVKPTNDLLSDLTHMQQATNFGSLIRTKASSTELEATLNSIASAIVTPDLFLRNKLEALQNSLRQLLHLGSLFHCVVDNPPYMGGGNMNQELSEFVKENYPDSKADLMACFMEAGIGMSLPKGFLGMINQETWMFKTTYQVLRKKIAESLSVESMIHLGPRTFVEINGEKVRSTAFSIINDSGIKNGVYVRLTPFRDSEDKRLALLNKLGKTYIFDKTYTENITENNWAYWLTENGVNILLKAKPLSFSAKPKKGTTTSKDDNFLKLWHEVKWADIKFDQVPRAKVRNKWFPVNKGGGYRKWYGLLEYVINWENDGLAIKGFKDEYGKLKSSPRNLGFNFTEGITWTSVSSTGFTCRLSKEGMLMTDNGATIFDSQNLYATMALLNSVVGEYFLSVLTPGFKYDVGVINKFPIKQNFYEHNLEKVESTGKQNVLISEEDWNKNEYSWCFSTNDLIKIKAFDLEETYGLYQLYWKNKFFLLHKNEEELNRQFIEIYGLQHELTPHVRLEDITILKEETTIENEQLVFHAEEVIAQFVSYAVGSMFGRYSLDKEGLILANQGETIDEYLQQVGKSKDQLKFLPDADNIIPVLDDEWFDDDFVSRFHYFLKASFGEKNFRKNLSFVEECLGKDIRKYALKDFNKHHIQCYQKRPIYWMFSSPKGYFNVLIYMHRYTPDTLNIILNSYLREFIEKLELQKKQLLHQEASGSVTEQSKARKQIDKIGAMLADCRQYEVEILYPLASERIEINLDDGVLVNYNKFGRAVAVVDGLNDPKTKKKIKEFDWIDTTKIR